MASTAEIKTEEKTFNFEWTIPYWDRVQKSVDEVLQQKFTFETLLFPGENISWEIGFSKKETDIRNVLFDHKLNILPVAVEDLDTTIKISLLYRMGAVVTNPTGKFNFQEKRIHTFNTDFYLPGDWTTHMDTSGSIKFVIDLTIRFSYDIIKSQQTTLIFHEFNCLSSTRTCKNWAALLENMNDSDLKIITNDDQEILAHKLVIKVQCPMFASTHFSKFCGNDTTTFNTDEISAKTMRHLLHYFYSGELLESLSDDDIIVEFTAAVAKYELKEVAEMLENDWKLLKLVRKMSLKQAEKRLNDRILNKARSVQSADELLALFQNAKMTDDDGEKNNMLVRANRTD